MYLPPHERGLMAPLIVLVAGWLLLRGAGRLAVERLSSRRSAGRGASAGMLVFTGATHLGSMKNDHSPTRLRPNAAPAALHRRGLVARVPRAAAPLDDISLAAELLDVQGGGAHEHTG